MIKPDWTVRLIRLVVARFKPLLALFLIATVVAVGAANAYTFFAICSNNNVLTNPDYIRKIADTGTGMCRIDLSFPAIRKQQNVWDWTIANELRKVAGMQPQMEWLPILGYGAPWAEDAKFATITGTISAPQRGIDVMPPESAANPFGNYVYETVKRYKDVVHNWESWNEPDLPGHVFFKGSGQDFMPYQRAFYLAAKRADPRCTAVFAGLCFANIEGYMYAHHLKPPTPAPVHSSFFEEYLQAVVKDPNAKANSYYFDAMNQHSYSRATDIADYSQIQQKLMRDYLGQEKPIWFTETGFGDAGGPWGGTPEEYCDYLLQTYCWGMSAGVQKQFHFQLDDSNGNGLYNGKWAPKLALQTYKLLTHEFPDVKFVAQLHGRAGVGFLEGNSPFHPTWTTGYNLFELKSKDGAKRYFFAFTDTNKPVDVKVPAKRSSGTLIDRLGKRSVIKAINSVYELHLAGSANIAGFPSLPDAKLKALGQPEHLVGGPTLIIVE